MIPAKAVERFLSRPVDDHLWLKGLRHKDLDRLLDRLDPPPHFWHKLNLHQKVGLYLGIVYGQFALWFDMGTGKTLTSLELLQYWWDCGELRRAIIFVTSDKAFPTWERQLKQYQISVPYTLLDADSSEGKWRIFERFGDGLIFTHYPGTVHMLSGRVAVEGKNKSKMVLISDLVRRFLDRVDGVVWDESTRTSNRRTLTFEMCLETSRQAAFRYALAGMPFGRDPTMLWPQMYLVDHGETLGRTLGIFRKAFFSESKNYWSDNRYSKEYKFKKDMQPDLSRILGHRSLAYTAEECIDLKEPRRIIERVRMGPEAEAFYRKLVEEIIAAKGNMRLMKNAFLRMRQLSSGFIGLKDDESGEKAEIDFPQNPKLDRLLELLDELPAGRKALVFYQYTHSARRITEALKRELGFKDKNFIWLWSGTKNGNAEQARFIEGDAHVAVIQNQLGAYSLDGFQVGNYEFHFESALSVIDRTQAERRIVRQGQLRKCFLYDIIMEDTADEKILDYHREGGDLFRALLADPSKLFRRAT